MPKQPEIQFSADPVKNVLRLHINGDLATGKQCNQLALALNNDPVIQRRLAKIFGEVKRG